MINFGVMELLLVLVILGTLFGGKYLVAAGTSVGRLIAGVRGVPWSKTENDATRSWSDARYEHGVRTGELAELFGVGSFGIRMPQVIALYFATLFSSDLSFRWANDLTSMDLGHALFGIAWPAVFVFSAITAIRSFQGFFTVAAITGLLYAILSSAVLFAAGTSEAYLAFNEESWSRRLATAFAWPMLTMLALQIGVRGSWRWARIAMGLAIAGALPLLVNAWLVLQTDFLFVLEGQLVQIVMSAVLWTGGFMIAQKLFGEPRAALGTSTSFGRSDGTVRLGRLPGAQWFIPLGIIVGGLALMQLS
jgi:hypothetical protein